MILKNIYISTVQISILTYIIYAIRNLIVFEILKTKVRITDKEIEKDTKDFPPQLIKFLNILNNNPILILILFITVIFVPLFNIIFSISQLKEIFE